MSTEPSLPATTSPPRRSWRRRFRPLWVRVSLVLLLIAAISLFSVWWPRRAVWSVLMAGGSVSSNREEARIADFANAAPAYLEPLWNSIREHQGWLFRDAHIGHLSIPDTSLDHRHWARFSHCSSLTELSTNGRQLGPGLSALSELRELRHVTVYGANCGTNLAELRRLPRLRSLMLYSPDGPVGELKELGQHPTLDFINVLNPRNPHAIVDQLAGWKNLQKLWIQHPTERLGPSLEALSSLPQLEEFLLTGPLTDEELLSISQLKSVTNLTLWPNVNGYVASREGWRSLQRLPKLRELNVYANDGPIIVGGPPPSIDEADPGLIEFLRTLLPACTVNRMGPR